MLDATIGRPIRTDKMSTDRKSRMACLQKRLRVGQSLEIRAHLVSRVQHQCDGFYIPHALSSPRLEPHCGRLSTSLLYSS